MFEEYEKNCDERPDKWKEFYFNVSLLYQPHDFKSEEFKFALIYQMYLIKIFKFHYLKSGRKRSKSPIV